MEFAPVLAPRGLPTGTGWSVPGICPALHGGGGLRRCPGNDVLPHLAGDAGHGDPRAQDGIRLGLLEAWRAHGARWSSSRSGRMWLLIGCATAGGAPSFFDPPPRPAQRDRDVRRLLTGSVAEGQQPHYQAAAAKTWQRPVRTPPSPPSEVFPHATPYVRRMQSDPACREVFRNLAEAVRHKRRPGTDRFRGLRDNSEGTASGYWGRSACGPRSGRANLSRPKPRTAPGFRARILKWEESDDENWNRLGFRISLIVMPLWENGTGHAAFTWGAFRWAAALRFPSRA